MTSKQRAYLKSLAMKLEPIYHIGKASLTTEIVDGIREALDARELIKIGVLKNCADDPREIAQVVSERTRSQVVQVIGKKIGVSEYVPHQPEELQMIQRKRIRLNYL